MTEKEFVRKLCSVRKAYQKAEEKLNILFIELNQEFDRLDLQDCPSNAENADNVEEAINCYAHYGKYDPQRIWEEIKMGYQAHS